MTNLTFRPARRDDSDKCVELCMLAIGRDLTRLFEGLKRDISPRDIVKALCSTHDTELSWRHFLLVERADTVIAGLCLVPAGERRRLAKTIPVHLREDCGIGPGGLARFLVRSVYLAISTREGREPESGLCIPVGAVYPPYREIGVATGTLEHVSGLARSRGFPCLYLYVDRTNSPAIALYHSLGFKEAAEGGRRKQLMVLSLNSCP